MKARRMEMATSPPQAWSPQEAAKPAAHVGQATYSEEDEFVDPSGKYKLVKKGMHPVCVLCTRMKNARP